jgi:hypothetical protein
MGPSVFGGRGRSGACCACAAAPQPTSCPTESVGQCRGQDCIGAWTRKVRPTHRVDGNAHGPKDTGTQSHGQELTHSSAAIHKCTVLYRIPCVHVQLPSQGPFTWVCCHCCQLLLVAQLAHSQAAGAQPCWRIRAPHHTGVQQHWDTRAAAAVILSLLVLLMLLSSVGCTWQSCCCCLDLLLWHNHGTA